MRLIDADALKKVYGDSDKAWNIMMVHMSVIKQNIDDMPTVDAVPVVHGRWIITETACEDTEAKCSRCGFETLVNEPGNGLHMVADLHYCTNCGAKMEVEHE